MCWLTKDIDGFYYFDMLLAAKEEFESEESYPLFRESIEDLINDNLNKGDIKLNQKYEWLQGKLNSI